MNILNRLSQYESVYYEPAFEQNKIFPSIYLRNKNW